MLASDLDVTYSPNVLEVNLEAVAHNVREVRRVIGVQRTFFAVLKGNALGFGSVEVGKTALSNGADALALVHIREAIRMREAGITAPILLYGGHLGDTHAIQLAERYDLTVAVVDLESAQLHSQTAHTCVRVFVEIDAGLERLGVPAEHAVDVVKEISRLPKLRLDGIFTHLLVDGMFADDNAEGEDQIPPFIEWQLSRFARLAEQLPEAGVSVPVVMAASSPLVAAAPEAYLTAVDTGRLIYGLMPAVPPLVTLDLQPAFHRLSSRLIQVREVHRSDFIAEAGFPIRAGMRIGIIPMGLADGLDLLHCGEVLVRGSRVKVIGTFYEHARLDLTEVPSAEAGDQVVIIGDQLDATISREEVVQAQTTRSPGGIVAVGGLGSAVREGVRRVYSVNPH